ncbi:amino acid deaminase/aldolase [Fredinandcohnia quinoae]|uniref:Amino acid deaminase/aldolase n=1 Tax=Fredinandcohnia quinoae TaxID=2918902 RepID=A0AAW5E9Q1_9BACI|nr:amino acid deaminase/aldolase [Fredinandcohnia sp. SECRCQ15]MCH1625479.1 amino acid deaminase/aldolase [Fredinandcohnia sp. SECRCQ15]
MLTKIPKDISLPALLLDVQALDSNCQKIASQAKGKSIRIATKSVRSIPVLKRLLASNPIFQGLMCYSPHEAIFLIKQGFDNLLLGYPCWDRDALNQISILNQSGKRIICMIDAIEHVDYLDKIANETNGLFYLCIDIDMSTSFPGIHFGVRRSPIKDAEGAVKIARKIKKSSKLRLLGIMGYEAQIAGVGDKVPAQFFKNRIVNYLKKKSIIEVKERRKNIVQELNNEGFSLELVNGGGTGSMHTTTEEDVVTEVTVGSGFYSPLLFDYYHDFQYNPALYFALPVVRKPAPNMYTCLGGGYVSSGPSGKDKTPKPVFPLGGELLPLEGAGEVQTPVYYENEKLEIGDPIIFRAAKAGEICERFNEIICIEHERAVDQYKTYRGEGVSFL